MSKRQHGIYYSRPTKSTFRSRRTIPAAFSGAIGFHTASVHTIIISSLQRARCLKLIVHNILSLTIEYCMCRRVCWVELVPQFNTLHSVARRRPTSEKETAKQIEREIEWERETEQINATHANCEWNIFVLLGHIIDFANINHLDSYTRSNKNARSYIQNDGHQKYYSSMKRYMPANEIHREPSTFSILAHRF